MRTNKRTFAAAEIVPPTQLAPIDLAAIFGRNAPLQVDLGCGDGNFLVALAQQNPGVDFVGVERMPGRVRSACRKIGRNQLANARVLNGEIIYAVQQFFAPGSVDIFHLMFSDPWPKRRHEHRRIVNGSFLRGAARALKPGGELHLATDHAEYFAAIEELARTGPCLIPTQDSGRATPLSTFEKHFRESGAAIYRLVLRKSFPPCI